MVSPPQQYFMPVFQILAPIPPTAWVPIALIFLGVGFPLRVFLVYLSSFFPIFLNTFQAIKDTDRRYVLSARVFGVNSWSILVPQALEGVATVGLLYAAVKRWFGPAAGLIAGAVSSSQINLTWNAVTNAAAYNVKRSTTKEFFRIPDMVVCMAVLGFIGWFLTEIIKYLEKRICLWKESRQEA